MRELKDQEINVVNGMGIAGAAIGYAVGYAVSGGNKTVAAKGAEIGSKIEDAITQSPNGG